MRLSTILHDGWTVQPIAGGVPGLHIGTVPARVPGSVHTDLFEAGAIPDPYLDENEDALRWIRSVTWRYARMLHTAPPQPGEEVDLVFDGLDTVATLTLDGVEIGRTANMHRSHRVDVTGSLTGSQELAVVFSPALDHAAEMERLLNGRPHAFTHPYNMVRKMACSFGWDWGPDLVTAGIWRPVRLERWRTARLASVRPVVDLDEDGVGHVRLHIDVERTTGAGDPPLTLRAALGSHPAGEVALDPGGHHAVMDLQMPAAPAWWPHGYGAQPLVDLEVQLIADGALDTARHRIGFRRVAVVAEADAHGTSFTLTVIGKPIQVNRRHPVQPRSRRRSPQRPRPRNDAHLGRVEQPRLHLLPGACAAVLCGVRVPGAPAWSTLHRVIHDHVLTPTSPGMLVHQKAGEGEEKLARGYAAHFPEPRTFRDWHWTTQLNQARAVTFAVEHFRSHWPRTSGSILWQLNDCWPVTSWAAVDYDGVLKPVWYALRRAHGRRLLTIQPRGERWVLAVVNDTDEPWIGPAMLRRERFDGTVEWQHGVGVSVPARSTELVALPDEAMAPDDPFGEALSAELAGLRAWHFFAEDLALSYDPSPLEISVERTTDGCRVLATARSLARDVIVLADQLSPAAVAATGLVTLRAGESAVIAVVADAPLVFDGDVSAWLRCANDLSHGSGPARETPIARI